jgi:cation:H+ antiporter
MTGIFQGLGIGWNVPLFCAGLLLIAKGASWFVDSAVHIARATHVPKMIIGATIVSVATTFPEFCVSGIAAVTGQPQTAVGNAVGSALCNAGLIVGLAALFHSIATSRRIILGQGAFMVAGGTAVFLLARNGTLGRGEGLLLLAGLALYVVYSLRSARRERARARAALDDAALDAVADGGDMTTGRATLLFLAGTLGVAAGSTLLVGNGQPIARALGVSPLLVALTFTAVGTSLPELVMTVTASLKGHADLGVGNVMGANALNMFWVLGGAALIRPIPITAQTLQLDLPCMMLVLALLAGFALTGQRLRRWEGAVLLASYIAYLALAVHWNVAA